MNDEIEFPEEHDDSEIPQELREKILGALGGPQKSDVCGPSADGCEDCDVKDKCDDLNSRGGMGRVIGLGIAHEALQGLPVNRLVGEITMISHNDDKKEIFITIKTEWSSPAYENARKELPNQLNDRTILVL